MFIVNFLSLDGSLTPEMPNYMSSPWKFDLFLDFIIMIFCNQQWQILSWAVQSMNDGGLISEVFPFFWMNVFIIMLEEVVFQVRCQIVFL